jgi:predicted ferric reductase
MKKFQTSLLIAAAVILIADLFLIDYNDLSWSKNGGQYLGIISMILIMISMIISIKKRKERED